jgi:cytochrome c
MKQSGLVWDTATLTALIKSPSGTVPGTKMRFLGFGYNERKVADLLAYLESAQGPAAPPQAQR